MRNFIIVVIPRAIRHLISPKDPPSASKSEPKYTKFCTFPSELDFYVYHINVCIGLVARLSNLAGFVLSSLLYLSLQKVLLSTYRKLEILFSPIATPSF